MRVIHSQNEVRLDIGSDKAAYLDFSRIQECPCRVAHYENVIVSEGLSTLVPRILSVVKVQVTSCQLYARRHAVPAALELVGPCEDASVQKRINNGNWQGRDVQNTH